MSRIKFALFLGCVSISQPLLAEVPVNDAYAANSNSEASLASQANFRVTPVMVDAKANNRDNAVTVMQPQQSESAAAPVVEKSVAHAEMDPRTMSMSERLNRLEQQLANMQQMQLLTNLDTVQQQIQDLQGRVDVQAHDLKTLQSQQRDIYQDLDKRLAKINVTPTNNANTVAINEHASSQPEIAPIGQEKDFVKEQHVYENAYSYIRNKHYDQAINSMLNYLKAYPSGRFAVNAHYWLGELYVLNDDETRARKHFFYILKNYPQNIKVADAMVKIGYIEYNNNKKEMASNMFRRVIKKYPGTASARLAEQGLQKIAASSTVPEHAEAV